MRFGALGASASPFLMVFALIGAFFCYLGFFSIVYDSSLDLLTSDTLSLPQNAT